MKSQEFMVRKEYRRAAVIVALGFLAVVLVRIGIRLAMGLPLQLGPVELLEMFLAPFFLGLLFVLFWERLRIDDRGISRRSPVRWTRWTWDEFECGRMDRGPSLHQYVRVPQRGREEPLNLNWFGDDAVAVCEPVIEQRIHPAPITIPGQLTVRYPRPLPIRTKASMDATGIRLKGRGQDGFFPWEAVHQVVVETMTPNHRDFLVLQIDLPDCRVKLTADPSDRKPLYGGPEPKVVRAFLEQYIPKELWVLAPRHGRPRTREGLIHEKQRLSRERLLIKVFLSLSVVLCLLFFVHELGVFRDRFALVPRIIVASLLPVLLGLTAAGVLHTWHHALLQRDQQLSEAEIQLNPGADDADPEMRTGI